ETKREWDVTPALTGLSLSDFPHERVLPTGCDFSLSGGPLSRWEDAAVEVYFDDTDAPAGFSGTLDAILGNMNSNYTGINAINGGQTSFTPDCTDNSVVGNDFINFLNGLNGTQATLIFFEDPCNQIVNLSGCTGVLAVGGSYSSSSTHSYKGDTWNDALWGFVVVNNGVLACLDPDQYELMLTHELTHTYRMDHLDATNFPSQNMNPSCCNAINFKDIECMNYTYDLAAPVELTAFDAQPYNERQVRVSWATASEKNNHHFAVEHSMDGLHFETIKTVSGNNSLAVSHYEWIDPLPAGGLNYYRLSQVDFDGHTTTFGLKAVNMGESDAVFRVFPNPARTGTITVLIDLPVAFNGTMEIIDPDGRVLAASTLALESGRNKIEQSVEHLSPGIHWLRFREAGDLRILKFFKN
ncbi:MAG TPA: T9SS type A sorting domain-containing protein, partial [Saprospiraceae bacterium]|nr:T9SS type A sorting domain-containing protein [Saprospiraceae bacterium]